MIGYTVLGLAALALLAIAGRQQAIGPTGIPAPTHAPTQVAPTVQVPGQPVPAQPAPSGANLLGPILPRIVGQIPHVGEECSEMDNRINAERWLVSYCPEYFDNSCGSPTYRGSTMTGDGTYFIEYSTLCFDEGAWGIPIPKTMTFNILMRDCQMVSYSYR